MNVKDAVKFAVRHVIELFEDEELTNVGLEEVEFDDPSQEWIVTVGFSRPWDYPQSRLAELAGVANAPKRSFKIVRINDRTQRVVAVKNWQP